MNVLHVSSGRGPTGAAAAAMTDVRALVAAGHRAFIVARRGSGLAHACQAEAVPCLPALRRGHGAFRLLHLPHDVRCLRSLIREYAVDVLHVHRSDDQLLAAAALGRMLSARLVRTWHRDPAGVPWPLRGRLASQPDGCVCVARDHAARLLRAGARRCEFIHAAVDTALYRPAERATASGGIRIVHVGRWKRDRKGRDRGQRAALDVFARLPPAARWKGFLVGRGELADALRHEAYGKRELSEERVEFINFAEQAPQRLAALLATFHLGLVFTPGSDGTSRAALELLACGVPLIVADRPGLRELAEDRACAMRELPDDPAGWARAIAGLLAAPERLADMSRAARERAERTHALALRGAALAEFYRAV